MTSQSSSRSNPRMVSRRALDVPLFSLGVIRKEKKAAQRRPFKMEHSARAKPPSLFKLGTGDVLRLTRFRQRRILFCHLGDGFEKVVLRPHLRCDFRYEGVASIRARGRCADAPVRGDFIRALYMEWKRHPTAARYGAPLFQLGNEPRVERTWRQLGPGHGAPSLRLTYPGTVHRRIPTRLFRVVRQVGKYNIAKKTGQENLPHKAHS